MILLSIYGIYYFLRLRFNYLNQKGRKNLSSLKIDLQLFLPSSKFHQIAFNKII